MTRLTGRQLGFAATILSVVAVIGAALWVIGSPSDERLRRLDDRRVTHLEAIADAVDRYWASHKRLPASLEEMAQSDRTFDLSNDPVTERPYSYRVLGERKYELCAEFQAVSRDEDEAAWPASLHFWTHAAGRQCFEAEPQAVRR